MRTHLQNIGPQEPERLFAGPTSRGRYVVTSSGNIRSVMEARSAISCWVCQIYTTQKEGEVKMCDFIETHSVMGWKRLMRQISCTGEG